MAISGRHKIAVIFAAAAAGAATTLAACQLHTIGAGALLYPSKRTALGQLPASCVEKTFRGHDVNLSGWQCTAPTRPSQGLVVYLHGIADNRASAAGVANRFTSRGYDFIAYDSRAHGASEGEHCTYGYYEKHDLRRVLDQAGTDRALLIGHSLGAAVALQTAAIDPRVKGIVAAAAFSDLRTIATERAPFIFTKASIAGAFRRAEIDGKFRVDEVSPERAAATITVPVLLIHGEADHHTQPAHSSRIFDALRGPKKLIMVPGAGHNDALNGDVWNQIEGWIASVVLP